MPTAMTLPWYSVTKSTQVRITPSIWVLSARCSTFLRNSSSDILMVVLMAHNCVFFSWLMVRKLTHSSIKANLDSKIPLECVRFL